MNIADRKSAHIAIPLSQNVQMHESNGLDNYRLLHQALPEINLSDVDTSVTFLGKKLSGPLIISSMTGGTEIAAKINTNLARACETKQIGLGVGSQRIALEKLKRDPGQGEKSIEVTSFQVRAVAPNILLFANLGAIQLNYGYTSKEVGAAISMIKADAIFLHLNPLQEAVQPGGDTDFKNLATKISAVVKATGKPVIIKEVGNGISPQTARLLKNTGVKIVDVAGSGGTSWGFIEAKRAGREKLAQVYRNWGISTAESIHNVKQEHLELIASGGIRTGIDIVKAIALGASVCGIALPFLGLGAKSHTAVEKYLDELLQEIKIAMFCIGVTTINELKNNSRVITRI